MNIINNILYLVSPSITIFMFLLSFRVLSQSKKIDYNYKNILAIIICGVLVGINTYLNDPTLRVFISFILLLILLKYVFKENIFKTFLFLLVSFIIVSIMEIILSSVAIVLPFINLEEFDKNIILKTIFSIIEMFLVYFCCHLNFLIKFVNKMINKINNSRNIIIFLVVTLTFLIMINLKFMKSYTLDVYISNIVILVCFTIVIIFGIFSYLKASKEVEKTEAILVFLKKYEKTIDSDREKRHELLNNLLTLKSARHLHDDEYDKILDDLINTYSCKSIGTKNIYKLPPGLKGIFYYKLVDLSSEGIKVQANISKNFSLSTKKLNRRDFVLLCKLIGITLDNAIEAARISTNKLINIDVYKEKKNYIIEIANSINKKVDIKKISRKDYSTKGKRRGLGLYLAKTLLENSDILNMYQSVDDNFFVTKISVKQKTS